MSTKVTSQEIDILENMFTGDKNRDASSSIRGFLFQDMVVIEKLLNDEVEYVCSEYLEDVDVFFKDGTFEIIQAKYYPHTSPAMETIMTDLYYQYLRLKLMDSKLKIKPLLVIHRTQTVKALDYEQLKTFINPMRTQEPKDLSNIRNWLTANVYILNKEEQKRKLFTTYAYDSSIKNFESVFEIIKKNNIENYQRELGQKLVQVFPSITVLSNDVENQKKILLGLAVTYAQRRYRIEVPSFESIRIRRDDFFEDINKNMQVCDENHIVAYLKSIAIQVIGEIVDYNEGLSKTQIEIVNNIYLKTLEWLDEIGNDIQGQFQIVNTLSDKSVEEVRNYIHLGIADRLVVIAECKMAIKQFLKYLWKIIYDICSNKEDFNILRDAEMLKPQTYIVSDEMNYICLHFPEDCTNTSAIMYANQEAIKRSRKNLCSRMMEVKPEKWFLKGNEAGKYDYSYSTAEIRHDNLVTNLDGDSFVIECMNCIKVDDDDWSVSENCNACIFSKSCIERKE